MRKLLIGTILGLTITGGADASIVSRGFFEEQIGNYATLDLLNSKANQKDLTALSNKIGILPDDITVQAMLEGWTDSYGYYSPGLLAFSVGETNVIDSYDGQGTAKLLLNGAKATTIDGLDYTGPVYPLWKLSEGIDKIASIETKIGTLPDGIPPALAEIAEQINERLTVKFDIKYPQSLEDLILDLYGTKEYEPGILHLVFDAMSFAIDHEDIINGVESQNRKGILERIDDVETQIGTLPAGYDSVGAALEAINAKVDNKITNLSATASNGKYVLTAVKEGDQTTYAWESIDRSESETTTTE